MGNKAFSDLARLKKRLIAVFIAFAACLMIGGLVYHAHFRASRRADVERLLLSLEQIKLQQLTLWREGRMNDAMSLADSPVLGIYLARFAADPSDRDTAALLKKRLQFYLRYNKYPLAALVDGAGRALLHAGEDPAGLSPQLPDLIRQARTSGRAEMGKFYRNRTDNSPHMDIVVPAVKRGRGRELLLVLSVDLADYLYPLLQTWSAKGDTGETLLVSREGGHVLFLNDLRHVKDAALTLSIPMSTAQLPSAMALNGYSGLVQGKDYRGVEVLAAVNPVPGTNWALVTKMDWDEAMAGTAVVGLLLLALILVLLAAAGGWTFYLFRGHAAEFMRGVMDSLPLGIAVNSTAPQVKFEYMNDHFPEFYRTTREALAKPDNFWDAVYEDPAFRAEMRAKVLADAASGDPARMTWTDIPITRKEGGTSYVDAQNIPLPGGGMMISVVADVTERRRALREIRKLNQDLVEKNREMENFLYVTSHDLRSPLVNIQGFSQNLADYFAVIKNDPAFRPGPERGEAVGRLLDEKIPSSLGFIALSVAKMDRLITALLRLSRLGRAPAHPQKVDMNGLLRQILSYFSFGAEKAGAELVCGDLPPCLADREALNQLFSNLVENALKYRHPDRPPRVEITGRLEAGRAVYEVRDNGLGIEASQADKIWQLFYRVNPAACAEGDGVGLSLVKALADKNGGKVAVTSEPGQWSVFRLEFPAAQE